MTAHFVEKSALSMWELEFQDFVAEHGPDAMTWSMFETFMHDQYGQLQTATEIRAAYDEMHQSDFDSVSGHLSDGGLDSDPDSDSHSEPDDDLLEQNQHSGQKRKRVPDADWEARRESASCYRCGEPGHIARECQAEL